MPTLSVSEVASVFGIERFTGEGNDFLQKHHILHDLVTKKRAASQKASKHQHVQRKIDTFDIKKLTSAKALEQNKKCIKQNTFHSAAEDMDYADVEDPIEIHADLNVVMKRGNCFKGKKK